ncbi:general transcription factor 3C polypeptide 5 [Seriola lalandi dorsalis]|uniref:Ral transcription factor IIIC subunit 5 n=1 Tax=Seriola lalandi dorsalis TaxID=1841481 RepID=A0A3B4XHY7_SERLL|nr:general transcription factor 3C polypeptide 5 [Seriola lalandi dorsalis]XP_056258683.1 general transcription factor 3C polypeptide 5 [Seriola aureovittata]
MADSNELKLDFTLKELTVSCPAEDDVPGSSSTVKLRDNRLVCVEYPAVINSVPKMLETLGGEQGVSKTFAHPNRRLELRFRPQDPFCHSLCGNRFPSSNLLLRVRRRVRKKDPKDAEIHMDVIGVIGTTYKFQGLADFQCLAVHSEGGKDMSLYDKIILRKTENQEFFEQPMPFFLPPAIFSRLDSPVDYFYRPDIHQKSVTALQMPLNKKNFIGLNRARRPHNAIFVSFSDATVPSECLEPARLNWARVCLKESDKEAEEHLKKMFESRPIWSRNAVKANINIHPDKLKLLLPVFAYYMVTGPWRSLWVRLGFDPRKSAESKKYQILDFRIRCSTKHGYSLSDMPVKAKRSALNYSLPITFNKAGPQPASVMDLPAQEGPSSSRDTTPITYQLKESSYIFREGMLPPHRQMFYQLCDLDVESIKEVIEQNCGNEQICNERDGWCVVGTTDKLRDMISAMIKKVIREQKPAMPELPKRTRRKGANLKSSVRDVDAEEPEEEDGENEEDDDDEFQPSEGSENEMETEILDYM